MNRRAFITGLLAAPAIVAVDSLMPLRGIKFDPIMRVQSWPFGAEKAGEWWVHTGPLSSIGEAETAMREMFGRVYSENVDGLVTEKDRSGRPYGFESHRFGYREVRVKSDRPPPAVQEYLASCRLSMTEVAKRREVALRYSGAYEANVEGLRRRLAEVAQWGT